jgi:hypothetical protein
MKQIQNINGGMNEDDADGKAQFESNAMRTEMGSPAWQETPKRVFGGWWDPCTDRGTWFDDANKALNTGPSAVSMYPVNGVDGKAGYYKQTLTHSYDGGTSGVKMTYTPSWK